MSKLSSRRVLGLSVLSTVGLYSLLAASPASAFILNGGNVTVSASDVNHSFDIFFDGNVATNSVSGLSSKATFTFLGFSTVGKNTEAAFKISLSNTSSDGISSRSSSLGFDVDQILLGTGSANKTGNTRTSGIFGNDRSGAFPNEFGDVDVCFTNGNTCQGGGNGGVTTGKSGDFLPILAFAGKVDTFTLSNFGVRYQSINGNGFNGDSGTGRGSSTLTSPIVPPVVTEPTPAPPVVVEPTPAPPVVVEPAPVPPIVMEPAPVPPIAVEPIPAPPVVVEPTPVVSVAVEPTSVPPVVMEPVVMEPAPVPPVVVEPTPAPPVAVEPTSNSTPQSVPEPGTITGLIMACLAMVGCSKRKG